MCLSLRFCVRAVNLALDCKGFSKVPEPSWVFGRHAKSREDQFKLPILLHHLCISFWPSGPHGLTQSQHMQHVRRGLPYTIIHPGGLLDDAGATVFVPNLKSRLTFRGSRFFAFAFLSLSPNLDVFCLVLVLVFPSQKKPPLCRIPRSFTLNP